jgi:hypothetical protein
MGRVNLKVSSDTRERLRELKRDDDGETWDELLTRLARYGELVNE